MPSLSKKTDYLDFKNAYHLLRRTTYNLTKANILALVGKTPDQALEILMDFERPLVPAMPLDDIGRSFFAIKDANGNNTTPDTDYNTSGQATKIDMTRGWWMYQAMHDKTAQHRITYWLHTLFITDTSGESYTNWDHWERLRKHTNQSLKDLAYNITFDPRMLDFLDNHANTKFNPNQNYGREFLELFTILKGEQIAAGNYTNYTEHDVQKATSIFSGVTRQGNVYDPVTRLNQVDYMGLTTGNIWAVGHVSENKQLSQSFLDANGNPIVIIGRNTDAGIRQEVRDFIDVVFNQNETAKAYCRRMYRYFVSREITAEIENDIITPLAAQLKNNGYYFLPVLKTLLSSKHFFDEEDGVKGDQVIGALAKNPMELYFQMFRTLEVAFPTYGTTQTGAIRALMTWIWHNCENSGMPPMNPLSVNGYSGYSSSPLYDKNWVTTASLYIRYNRGADHIVYWGLSFAPQSGYYYQYSPYTFSLDLPAFVKNGIAKGYFSDPSNGNTLLNELIELMIFDAYPERRQEFSEIFFGGLSLTNWKNSWNSYISTNNADGVREPLKRLVKALINSPEFQTM